MPKRISTARGRELGAGLRAALASAGLSSRDAAAIFEWDESKVSGIVNGKGGASQLEVAVFLGACRVRAAELAHLMSLHSETHVRDWWQQHGVYAPIWLRTLVEHLKLARTVTSWHTHMVPVFLQTAEYVLELQAASATAPRNELQDRVQAQLALQELIKYGVTRTFFIDELTLHRMVGGAEAHARQMMHLVRMANLPNVTIRILPSRHGAHAGHAGPFTRLTFEQYEPLVWVEAENSSLFIESQDAVKGYEKVISALDETSLNEAASVELIASMCVGAKGTSA
ncbi:Scr1 family TA system antitoxin-like transcriptional regulator [Lentzea sp. NPDC102401]|uniref:Scr1 family TA system antitoxin-like transcriptional regulator n=1 Tax=Lentzea sp. NPDC102401 TaxID=3364128 RepID=UPI00381D41E4